MDEVNIILDKNKQNYSFFALNILKTKAKELFSADKTLFCLTKSDIFFHDLLNTFNGLSALKISPALFEQTVQNIDISSVDKTRLQICAKLYKSYIETMEQNSFTLPFYKNKVSKTTALSSVGDKIKQHKNCECIEFSDVQSECQYIIDEIKNKTAVGAAAYKDFAIFADKTQMREKILDMLKAAQIPVISGIYHEEYENIKYKISVYHNMAEILQSLGIKEFSSTEFKQINCSKALKEIKLTELDEEVKTFATEAIENVYVLDKLIAARENSPKSLVELIFSNIQNFDEQDRENLNKEFGLFKHFYELYLKNSYSDAVKLVINSKIAKIDDTETQKIVFQKMKSLEELQKLFDVVLRAQPDFEAFKELLKQVGKLQKDNAVSLQSITSESADKKTFKYVYIAGLTENNFPGQNPSYPFISAQANEVLTSALKRHNPDFDSFIKVDEMFYSNKYEAFLRVVALENEKLTLSTHTYEAKKQVQPSVVFKTAVQADESAFKKLNDTPKQAVQNDEQKAEFTLQDNQKVVGDTEVLKLNPSAINTFLNCPRKYYYKNLLNLKEASTFAASYGSLVHAVFEVMNRRFLDKYTKDTALALCEVLLNAQENPQAALDAGFKQIDVDLVDASSKLALEEMKTNFKDAVEDYDLSGCFDKPPTEAVCEKSFTFELEELPNIVFNGRIDAILCDSEGDFKIVDYKTGLNKTNTLNYAISENGVNFLTKTGKEPSNKETLQKAYDYQIPLYYLACQNSRDLEEFKGKISKLGLVYIRPKSKDNGCDEDFVEAEKIEFYKDKIIQNLKETVIDKIVNETEFKPAKSFACANCGYKFLCDGEDGNE